jgi:peptidyl-prolyl cis-trans isomerase SurA
VTIPYSRLSLAPAALLFLSLAGCGTPSGTSPGTSSVASDTGTPTTTPPVTPVTITGGTVAAEVNGHAIPMSQFRFLYSVNQHGGTGGAASSTAALAKQTMNEVILDEIVRQYADAHHISVSNAEIDSHVRQDITQTGGKKAFEGRLAQYGLTEASYRRLLAPALLSVKVESRIAPPDTAPVPVAHVRHILIATKPQGKKPRTNQQALALAENLLHQIRHGASFATLAKEYSDDTGSGQSGGDLGNIYPNQTVKKFDHASFHQPLGTYAIVHTVYGYHIIEVLSRSRAPLPTQQQQQQQTQVFERWLNARVNAAKIRRIAQVKAS